MESRPCANLLRAILLFLSVAITASSSLAQGQGQGPLVKQIDVQYSGPETISRERILANLQTKVGVPYTDRAVEQDIRSLYDTGEVSNVRMFAEPLGDGVKVTVLLVGRPVVEEILLEGFSVIRETRIRREISSKVGESLNEMQLEDDKQKIIKLYEDRYFSDVQVKVLTKEVPGTTRVRVIFQINEGPKMVVKRISFVGNESVLPKDLLKVMKTKTSNILSFITKAGRLQPAQIEEDRAAIRSLYQNRGFIDAQVLDVQTQPYDDSGVDLIITVREGPEYRVNRVTIEGSQVLPPEQLKAQFKMVEGSLYTPKGMADDLKALRDFYGRQGYVDMIAIPEVSPSGLNAVNITYRIDEGVQSYVNLVNIQGNTRTQDRVIRRELAVRPGDVFDTTLVDVSRDRLNNLNYFSKVETVPQNTIIPGRKDLNVIVEEKRTGSFNFGAGFSTIDSLVGFAELQQTNFDILNWPSFVGGGQRFRARVQYGISRKDFVLSLTEPWFLGYKLSVGGEAYYREANFLSTVYDQTNYGFAFQARKAILPRLAVRAEYRIEAIDIFNVNDDVGQAIIDSEGTNVKSSILGELTYDTRDSLFLTRKGELLTMTGFIAGGFLGGDVQDFGLSLAGTKFFPLPWDMIFLVRGEISFVDTWGGDDFIPVFDRLYLGGANNLRGFDFRDVGPKDDNGNPIGGNSMSFITTELTFPIITRVRGAVFFDAGFVNADSFDYSWENANADIGIGVRLELPIGPVRVDYGIPIKSDQYNGGTGKFNFNIGYQF